PLIQFASCSQLSDLRIVKILVKGKGIIVRCRPKEAQAVESPEDFIHKLRITLKELREIRRWLKFIQRVSLIKKT
ncbi:hypothetical protein DRN50_08885, partial [Thermococci archaeon]